MSEQFNFQNWMPAFAGMTDFISQSINIYLNLDPESQHRLQKLKGKIVTIELLPFHFTFQCQFSESGVSVTTENVLQAETIIRGTPLQMMGMILNKSNRQRFFAEDIRVEGNAELGQDVIALFDELQIDWEDYLAQVVGDSPAHHTGQLVRNIGDWFSNTVSSFKQNINEFIHEETEWFPQREALHDLFHDIDTLRMDVDRAEEKIRKLREQHE